MDSDNLAREATEIGLELNPEHLAQLGRASALTRRLAAEIPRDLPPAQESALTLRLRRRKP